VFAPFVAVLVVFTERIGLRAGAVDLLIEVRGGVGQLFPQKPNPRFATRQSLSGIPILVWSSLEEKREKEREGGRKRTGWRGKKG